MTSSTAAHAHTWHSMPACLSMTCPHLFHAMCGPCCPSMTVHPHLCLLCPRPCPMCPHPSSTNCTCLQTPTHSVPCLHLHLPTRALVPPCVAHAVHPWLHALIYAHLHPRPCLITLAPSHGYTGHTTACAFIHLPEPCLCLVFSRAVHLHLHMPCIPMHSCVLNIHAHSLVHSCVPSSVLVHASTCPPMLMPS